MIYLLFTAVLMPAVIVMVWAHVFFPSAEPTTFRMVLHQLAIGAVAGALVAVAENLLGTAVTHIASQGLATYLLRYLVAMGLVQVALTYAAASYLNRAYPFRGVLQVARCVIVLSIGLALFEYVLYSTQLEVGAAMRLTLLSMPGHVVYGAVFGVYAGLSRQASRRHDGQGAVANMARACLYSLVGYTMFDAALFSQKVDVIVMSLALELVIMLLAIIDLYRARERKRAAEPKPKPKSEPKPEPKPAAQDAASRRDAMQIAQRDERQVQPNRQARQDRRIQPALPTQQTQPAQQDQQVQPVRSAPPIADQKRPDQSTVAVPRERQRLQLADLAVPLEQTAPEPVLPWWQVVALPSNQQQAPQRQNVSLPPSAPMPAPQSRASAAAQAHAQTFQNPRDMTPQQQQEYLRRQRERRQQAYERQQRARQQQHAPTQNPRAGKRP